MEDFCQSNGIHFCKDLVNSALVRLYHALCCFIVIKCLVTLSNTIWFQIQFRIHETSPWSSQPQGKHQSGSSLLRDKLAQPGMLTRVRVVGVVTHVNNHANSANSPHHPLYSPQNRTSHDNQPDNQDVEDQWCVTRYPGLRKESKVLVEKVISIISTNLTSVWRLSAWVWGNY